MRNKSLRVFTLMAAASLAANLSFGAAVNYAYTNWTSSTASTSSAGSASGTLDAGNGLVNVSYSGSLLQLGNISGLYNYPLVYTNSQVLNLPTNNQVLELTENPAFTQTITFSSAVYNPILDIVSLGNGPYNISVSYNFSSTPTLLSQGSGLYQTCTTSPCMSVTGNSLTGVEGDGVIEFPGWVSSITFTTTGQENWNGFTIGAQTPEPGTWAMGLSAIGLVAGMLRRRRAAK